MIEIISIGKGTIFLFGEIDLLLEIEGVDRMVDNTVDVLLL